MTPQKKYINLRDDILQICRNSKLDPKDKINQIYKRANE